MECRNFKELADSYPDDEPAVEDNHDLRYGELRAHLEGCADCRRELAARREVRAGLQRAVTQSPDFRVRPEFAFQLRNNLMAGLKQPERKSVFASLFVPLLAARAQWLAVAACLVVAVVISFIALTSRLTSTQPQVASVKISDTNEPRPGGAAVRLARFEQTKTAVGDHRFCALDYQLEEEPIPLGEAGRRFDAVYTDLAEAVMAGRGKTIGEVRLVEEHSCVYHGQRFAHVVLEHRGRTVSVLVTEKPEANDGTLAAVGNAAPVSTPDTQAVACAQIEGYRVSCFETKRHAVYTVSDLSEAENLAVARAFAPSVSRHITQTEVTTSSRTIRPKDLTNRESAAAVRRS